MHLQSENLALLICIAVTWLLTMQLEKYSHSLSGKVSEPYEHPLVTNQSTRSMHPQRPSFWLMPRRRLMQLLVISLLSLLFSLVERC